MDNIMKIYQLGIAMVLLSFLIGCGSAPTFKASASRACPHQTVLMCHDERSGTQHHCQCVANNSWQGLVNDALSIPR